MDSKIAEALKRIEAERAAKRINAIDDDYDPRNKLVATVEKVWIEEQ